MDKVLFNKHMNINKHTHYKIYICTSSTHSFSATPIPITLTRPIVTTSQFIISVTCETTSVFIGRYSIISQWTSDHSIIRISKGWTRNCLTTHVHTNKHTHYKIYICTSSTHSFSTTPAPIALTGPSVTAS